MVVFLSVALDTTYIIIYPISDINYEPMLRVHWPCFGISLMLFQRTTSMMMILVVHQH